MTTETAAVAEQSTAEEMERLRDLIVELEADHDKQLRRFIAAGSAVADITAEVGRGVSSRADQIKGLLRDEETLKAEIGRIERRLADVRDELDRLTKIAEHAELEKLFERMRQRREKIIGLVREAALEMGQLHSEDRAVGIKLLQPTRCLAQTTFVSLLEPIDYLHAWSDQHRGVVLDYTHIVKVLPFVPLSE